jgi:hypothetical protein
MQKVPLFRVLATLALASALLPLQLQAQPKKKKVVFIIADGIPADILEKCPHPFLEKVAGSGGYKRAYVGGEKGGYSQTPTISAVGYNSLLTGTWVNKHNVRDNDIKDPNYYYPSIFRLLKESDSTKKTALFSTWLDNRTKLVGESLPQTGSFAVDFHSDGWELDTLHYPHDNQSSYIHAIDEKVTIDAENCIREEGPDLTWLYLEYTDDMGHRHGESPEFREAIGYTDKQVGRIWNAIKYRQEKFPEDWLLIVTTDHGRDSINAMGHGGQSSRERTTWIVTNAGDLNHYYRNYPPAIVDIMPTIARFMGLAIPRQDLLEIDGTPLTGKLSLVDPRISLTNGQLNIRWKAMEKEGVVKIWLATTNHFKTGGRDEYKLLAQLPVEAQSVQLGVGAAAASSKFYKIVLEAPYNTVNRWVVLP